MTEDQLEKEKFKPWNKGKSLGKRKPFTRNQITTLREMLKNEGKQFDLVLFSLSVDTALRSSDLRSLKVGDVRTPMGDIKNRVNIKQIKTKVSHIVNITDFTAHELLIFVEGREDCEYLFKSSKSKENKPISRKWHSELVKSWCKLIKLDYRDYATHSSRRTLATLINKDKNTKIEHVQKILGCKNIQNAMEYIDDKRDEALNFAQSIMSED